ncbi:MAG: MogA/MoaB family molybdenum cofactor biosynthesis protein [Planctomycetota bacterium]|nr:MAG: MogA/MoaB family molybdenum cofactor biosynthesis protein [Planctomycetota bacterium]
MSESSHQDHQRRAERAECTLQFGVLTVSDTRTEATDASGAAARELIRAAGHVVTRSSIVPDDPDLLRTVLEKWLLAHDGPQVVVTTGGTGISPRDGTYEVVSAMLSRRLDGFGELFRWISYQQIGPAAMLSRAVGGVAHGRLLFATPGSTNAVRTALTELILPQAVHLWQELNKQASRGSE